MDYRIIILFFLSLLTSVLGPANLKIMAKLDVRAELYLFLGLALFQIFLLTTRMVTWFKILKKVRLSVAYPIVSITFPIMLFISNKYFGEKIVGTKIAGTILIISGIIINQVNND